MSRAAWLAFAAQAVVIALAWALSRRRAEHRPFAVFAMFVVDVARLLVMTSCPWIVAPGPFEGARRVVFHVDQALFNAWPVGVAMLAWLVHLGRRPWAPLLVGALVEGALVLGYPEDLRGNCVRRPMV